MLDHDLPAFQRKRRDWRAANGDRLGRVLAALEPLLVISDDPTPLLPIPGLSTFIMPFRAGADMNALRADLDALLEPWAGVVSRSAGGLWTLSLHESGLVRFPTWAVVESGDRAALVAGWGPQVIERARAMLSSRGTSRSSGPSPRP